MLRRLQKRIIMNVDASFPSYTQKRVVMSAETGYHVHGSVLCSWSRVVIFLEACYFVRKSVLLCS